MPLSGDAGPNSSTLFSNFTVNRPDTSHQPLTTNNCIFDFFQRCRASFANGGIARVFADLFGIVPAAVAFLAGGFFDLERLSPGKPAQLRLPRVCRGNLNLRNDKEIAAGTLRYLSSKRTADRHPTANTTRASSDPPINFSFARQCRAPLEPLRARQSGRGQFSIRSDASRDSPARRSAGETNLARWTLFSRRCGAGRCVQTSSAVKHIRGETTRTRASAMR